MIKAVFPALATLAALSGCATLPHLETPPISAFEPVPLPGRVFVNTNTAIEWYLARANIGEATVKREIGRHPDVAESRIALVTTSGHEDDSVEGQQWRLVLISTDIGVRVNEAGVRYNCRRGPNPGWSRNPCP